MSVSSLLSRVQVSNEHLEANLSTMLQSVRGTKQYWFIRQSELRCMIREWGSPTLFLTFSCAEYESPDITEYLRRVNDVSASYDIGKLCTEDPISVSRKFSLKFHAFFHTVLVKGEVLGKVKHFYWKKEYQARGAPHYHVLLWIGDAPVIGRDDPDRVLAWIQERRGLLVTFQTRNPMLSYTGRLLDTKPTNVVRIANEDKGVLVTLSLPGAGLNFHAKCVKVQN